MMDPRIYRNQNPHEYQQLCSVIQQIIRQRETFNNHYTSMITILTNHNEAYNILIKCPDFSVNCMVRLQLSQPLVYYIIAYGRAWDIFFQFSGGLCPALRFFICKCDREWSFKMYVSMMFVNRYQLLMFRLFVEVVRVCISKRHVFEWIFSAFIYCYSIC